MHVCVYAWYAYYPYTHVYVINFYCSIIIIIPCSCVHVCDGVYAVVCVCTCYEAINKHTKCFIYKIGCATHFLQCCIIPVLLCALCVL